MATLTRMGAEGSADGESAFSGSSGSLEGEGSHPALVQSGTIVDTVRPGPGEVVGDRFVVVRLAAIGGMGEVYQASDRITGGRVALKVTRAGTRADVERFEQEARILADLSHPAIVRHVASGVGRRGEAFLAMEWLDGLHLGELMAKRRLSEAQAIDVVRRVCEGLAVAHACGVVHRDVKPSNIFLVEGDPTRVKLLDFGIARSRGRSGVVTSGGTVLGTVGYMAPEQVRGASDVDARADVFSLGCVLFECLTGRPAFSSEHDVAVLVKVLVEDAPSVRRYSAEIPREVEAVVTRMMAKDRDLRPLDASAVLAELARLDVPAPAPASAPELASWAPREVMTGAEQRFMSVLLVTPIERTPAETLLAGDALAHVRAVVQRHGADLVALADGLLVATHAGRGNATDRAASAASCALAVREALPIRSAALASGLTETVGKLPVGSVIDRAAELLRRVSSRGRGDAVIAIDATTSSLVDARFVVHEERDDGAERPLSILRSEKHLDAPRTLLGRPSPCVGRETELAILDAVADATFSQPAAHAVLVTGPAGVGKSRLRSEFVARVSSRRPLRVLVARGDPVGAGSSIGIVRQLVRRAAGVAEEHVTDPAGPLRAYLARLFDGPALARVGDFLAELVGAPPPGDVSPQMRAARNDARVMGEWLRRCFEEWVEAECRRGPVLIVVDDLHWGDLSSVTFLEKAFRRVPELPLMILALARPEVHDVFPKLRHATGMQEILLRGLTPRPARKLVRTILGDEPSDAVVDRIVDRADGNAFYLEELIRHVAAGKAELPETIVGMAETRLETIEAEGRRVLRAASIFGDVFWSGAVTSLLGPGSRRDDVGAWLQTLVDREIVVAEPADKFPSEQAYGFRHTLLREAAYAQLAPADRAAGHRLAAQWLEALGEKDPLVVGDHYVAGGRPDLAAPFLLRAAEIAIAGGNPDVALAIARRAAAGAAPEIRGRFVEIEQLALAFKGAWPEALAAAADAMTLLLAGSTAWFRSAGSRMVAAVYLGQPSAVVEVLRASASLPTPEASGPFGMAMHMLVAALLHAGAREMALPFVDRVESSARREAAPDPAFAGWLRTIRCTMALFIHDDVALGLASARAAVAHFDSAADVVGRAVARMNLGIALIEAGSFDEGRALLRDVAARAHRMLLPTEGYARYYLARLDVLEGDTESSRALLDAAPGVAAGARGALAEALFRTGRWLEAEAETLQVETSPSVYARASALSVRTRIALGRGDPAQALALAERGVTIQDEGSLVPFWRSILFLARVEALYALGRDGDGDAALRAARDRIERIANGFDDPTLGEAFRVRIDANARTLTLARERFGPSAV